MKHKGPQDFLLKLDDSITKGISSILNGVKAKNNDTAFDKGLLIALPGRIGTIRAYKSG